MADELGEGTCGRRTRQHGVVLLPGALLLLSGCRAGTARVEIDGLRRRSLSFHRFEFGVDAWLVEGFSVEFPSLLTTAGRVSSLAESGRKGKRSRGGRWGDA
ncbi:unnamed protein product [Calypogeia fissa]